MINRRQLVAAAGSAALFARIPKAFAATYDLIIKGGRVIDPSAGLDAVRDVAISARPDRGDRADIAGRCHRDPRCARQDRRPGPDRHSRPCRPQQGGAADVPAGRRDRLGRCRHRRRRQHGCGRGRRPRRAADRPLPGQHRAHRRDHADRRVARHQRRQCGAGARRHRAQPRRRGRRQGAAVRTTSRAPTISRPCAAPRRRRRLSACRS